MPRIPRRLTRPLALFASPVLLGFAALASLTVPACGGLVTDPPPAEVDSGVVVPPPPPPRDAGRPGLDAALPPAPPRPPLPPVTQAPEILFDPVESGQTVTLAVPPNALGFNVVVRGEANDVVGIRTLTSPSGEVVLRDHRVIGASFETSEGDQGIAAASVPQNRLASAAPVEPGAWTVQVTGPTGRALRVSARVQISGDGTFRGGAADLHVYLPKGLRIDDPTSSHVVSAATAATDRAVEARLSPLFQGLEAGFGVIRGDVTFHDVDAAFLRIANESALARAFGASSGVADGGQALHVLFTNDLDLGDGVWGIAPGIPGAATRTGTSMSGVVLAITPETPADLDGLALLHEFGHFIGLAHTTEFSRDFVDPLDDTPSCVGILDPQRPSSIDRCPDKNNLMFPTLWGDTITVSDSQRIILRGSPSYKAFVGAATPVADAGTPLDAGTPPGFMPPRAPGPTALPIARGAIRLTRSGRPLTATERFVFGGLCGQTPLDAGRFAGHLGGVAAREELARMAHDADLPGILRTRAARMLAHAPR
ncbi:MAG: hypothetical protein IPF92_25315 [Myxococcales bacterium]|nr:hypothetical protein [Myxococcales bacterium]MBL0195760.1 hypothetical protein [Myxococcales bacterium]HQY60046.1 hypothetical protein [Polyangiaceae bacterium]